MQMWPGHVDEFDMEASRMANMLHAHVPLAMSLCHVDYANLKMQSSLSNHMYSPGAFEGILELRKEKSRDAARSRRGKENYEFYELAKLLPLPAAITSQLDKASIIRLTISYLKLRDFSSHGDPPWNREPANKPNKTIPQQCRNSLSLVHDVFETHQGTHILQSLDGFAFALSNDGRFLYISETVSIYLGLSQVEMAGSSVFEYIHSSDHRELAEQLGLNAPKGASFPSPRSVASDDGSSTPNPPRSSTPTMSERVSVMSPNPSKGYDRCFCIRMKSTLTKRGVHFKSSGYRVVQIVAHLRPQVTYPVAQKQLPPLLGLVGMAIALPPPTITELIIDNDMFITRLSPQFKVTYCEPRIADMMDITSEDLMNKNLYDHCHAEDLQKLNKAHTDLLNKGQVLTDYYRLMNRHGGYVWIQTCATIICNAKNAEEQNVIAINYVLSGVEYAGCVMNLDQFRILSKSDPDLLTRPDSQSDPTTDSERSAVVSLPHHNTDDGHFGACESSKTQYRLTKTAEIGSSPNHFDQFGSSSSLAPAGHDDAALRSAAEGELRGSSGRVELLFERTGTSSMIAKTQGKGDPKNNSRRKMEKPRKRKRLSDGDAETKVAKITTERSSTSSSSKSGLVVNAGNNNDEADKTEKPLEKPLTSSSSSSLTDVDDMPLGVGLSGGGGGRGSHEYNGRTSSPTPEDLSTGRPATSPAEDEARNQHDDSSTDLMASGGTAAGMGPWLLRSAGNAAPSYPQDGTASSSSVLDLEEAMNKHLPVQTTSVSDHHALGYGPHQQVLGGLQRHKSTIQWIGAAAAAAEAHGTPHGAIGGSELSASTLLRSLYPSRESVIRTNIYSSRPQQYYDIQNALLTPPGGGGGGGGGSGGPDVYKDSFSSVSLLNHHSKTPTDGGGGGGGSYGLTTNCYAATSALGLGGMTAADAAAAYSMTPPSSVSPQENYMSQFLDMHLHADRVMMQQYCTSGGGNGGGGTHQGHRENPVAALSMPIIRPQAYSLPAAHGGSSHHHHLSAYEHHAMPYHAGGYYASNVGVAAYNYVTGGSNASHYRDAMKNVNSW